MIGLVHPKPPASVLAKFQQFNKTPAGVMAFLDWCEQEEFAIPFLQILPEEVRYEPKNVEFLVCLWALVPRWYEVEYCMMKHVFKLKLDLMTTIHVDVLSVGNVHDLVDALTRQWVLQRLRQRTAIRISREDMYTDGFSKTRDGVWSGIIEDTEHEAFKREAFNPKRFIQLRNVMK